MAKDDKMLELEPVAETSTSTEETAKKSSKKAKSKKNEKKGPNRFVRWFKGLISELKKVEWPPFAPTKNNPGVLKQTGIVLLIVFFFVIIVTLIDLGLTSLLELLVGIA